MAFGSKRRGLLCAVAATVLLAVAAAGQVPASSPVDSFVSANGVRLHYVDWGGRGPVLLFLTGLGGNAHAFDGLAPSFTDRFHVLAVTRRGQGQSDQPPTGYDPATLAEDIRGFLDALRIDRVTLIGYSVGGSEQTKFAGTYPQRVDKLVYLDAAADYKSGQELATNPRTKYPLPLPEPDGPIGAIMRESTREDADYTKITAPALSFVIVYDGPYIPADADAELRIRLVKRWEEFGHPFERQQIDHFRRDMRNGKVIEVSGHTHDDFVSSSEFQRYLAGEMRQFLLGAENSRQR